MPAVRGAQPCAGMSATCACCWARGGGQRGAGKRAALVGGRGGSGAGGRGVAAWPPAGHTCFCSPSVMSTCERMQFTHMLLGLGRMLVPHRQQSLLGRRGGGGQGGGGVGGRPTAASSPMRTRGCSAGAARAGGGRGVQHASMCGQHSHVALRGLRLKHGLAARVHGAGSRNRQRGRPWVTDRCRRAGSGDGIVRAVPRLPAPTLGAGLPGESRRGRCGGCDGAADAHPPAGPEPTAKGAGSGALPAGESGDVHARAAQKQCACVPLISQLSV